MTPKGATMIIEGLSMRVFEIENHQERLNKEKEELRIRIKELELIRDGIPCVGISPIINLIP